MSSNNKIVNLLDKTSSEKRIDKKRLKNAEKLIKDLWDNLLQSTKDYDSEESLNIIKEYLNLPESERLPRIQYSELTSCIFNTEEKGNIQSNLDALFEKVVITGCNHEDENEKKDCQKIIIKFYDHIQLANYQIENIKSIADGITQKVVKDSKKELIEIMKNKYSEIEKQNITILGMFSAIVITIVAGMVFSTSVLSNMSKVGTYKLVAISSIIGFVFLNLVYMMFSFIAKLNEDKKIRFFNIRFINGIFGSILILDILTWCDQFDRIWDWLDKVIFWV